MMHLRKCRRCQRAAPGFALFLVLVALVTGVLIGTTFLLSSSSAASMGRQADDRLSARLVAEAGLAMANHYISAETNWRSLKNNGEWVADHPLLGGTVSIWGEDGHTIDANGNVVGDGDLSNAAGDPYTLTSLGVFGRARCRLRVTVIPGATSTIAVAERIMLKYGAAVDSYNHTIGAYGPTNNGATSSISSNSTGKPNILLSPNSRITGKLYLPAGGDPARAVSIVNNVNKVPLSSIVSGGVANLAVEEVGIPDVDAPEYTPSGNNLTYSSGVTEISGDLACASLTLKGTAVLKAVGNARLFCDGELRVEDNAQIVLDNPRFGETTAFDRARNSMANRQVAARLILHETVDARAIGAYVRRSGRRIRMAIYSDDKDEPALLMVQTAVQTMTGDSFYWHEIPISPRTLTPGKYWLTLSFDDNTAEYCFKNGAKTEVRNNAAVSGGFLAEWGKSDDKPNECINIYVAGNVPGQGASLEIYAGGDCIMTNNVQVNINTGQPTRLTLHDMCDETNARVVVSGSAQACATVHAPDALLHTRGNASLSGLIRVNALQMDDNSALHVDISEGTAMPGALVDESITINGAATVDGIGGGAILACNAVGTPVIWLRNNAIVNGDTNGGPGGAGGNTGIQVGSHARVTGHKGNLKQAVDISAPVAPTDLTRHDALICSSGTQVISSDLQYPSLTVRNNGVLEIDGRRIIVVTGKTLFRDNALLRLRPGARLTLYCATGLVVRDNAQVNLNGDPDLLNINYSGSVQTRLLGQSSLCATLRAPLSEVRAIGSAQIFGSIFSKRLLVNNSAKIHYDDTGVGRMAWIEGD
jgi:hypothetical protein